MALADRSWENIGAEEIFAWPHRWPVIFLDLLLVDSRKLAFREPQTNQKLNTIKTEGARLSQDYDTQLVSCNHWDHKAKLSTVNSRLSQKAVQYLTP